MSDNKTSIKTLDCCLGYLYIENIIILLPMSNGLMMPKSINKFFYETWVLTKQVKHIFKILFVKAEVFEEIINTDLVGPIILIRQDISTYSFFLINNATLITIGMLFKELSKYIENI